MDTTTKVRLNKKKCQSGLDGMNLEYKIALDGMDKLYLEKEELKNKNGNTVVEIDCVGGKVRVYVNAVNGVRPNNVKPIGNWRISPIAENINMQEYALSYY